MGELLKLEHIPLEIGVGTREFDDDIECVPPEAAPVTVVSLNVSHDCNLNCRHCYGEGGPMQEKNVT